MIVVMLCCHVRRYMQVCHVMLQNACCDSDLSADFLNFGTSNFPFKSPFEKCFEIVFFSLWRRDPVLELQLPMPLRVVLLCFATQSLQIAL